MTYTPLRRSLPGAPRWARATVGAAVAALFLLPVAVNQGWVHALTGVPKYPALLHGEQGPVLRDTSLDPGRARFGVIVLIGVVAHALLVGGGRCWLIASAAVCWVAVGAFIRVELFRPLGLDGHEVSRASYALLALVDCGLVAVGLGLVGAMTRSWRLAALLLGSFVLVAGLGYLARFGRGGAWVVSPLQVPVGFSASLFSDVARVANALWQPLVAITLIGVAARQRRLALERNPGEVCPHCEYPLPTSPPRVCSECGWSVDEAGTGR